MWLHFASDDDNGDDDDFLYIGETRQMCSIVERAILEVDEDEDGMINHYEFIKLIEHIPIEEKFSLRFLIT